MPPVRMTTSTSVMRHQLLAFRRSGAGNELQRLARDTARQKHSHSMWAVSTVSEAGLRITVLPAASAAATPPHGMAIGKFQGETTTTTPRGRGFQFRQRAEIIGRAAVELDEIDRFRYFRIGFGQRLAAFGQGDAHQVAAGIAQLLGRAHAGWPPRWAMSIVRQPSSSAFGTGDGPLDVFRVGLAIAADHHTRPRRIRGFDHSSLGRTRSRRQSAAEDPPGVPASDASSVRPAPRPTARSGPARNRCPVRSRTAARDDPAIHHGAGRLMSVLRAARRVGDRVEHVVRLRRTSLPAAASRGSPLPA